jgi:hypothetical protein
VVGRVKNSFSTLSACQLVNLIPASPSIRSKD